MNLYTLLYLLVRMPVYFLLVDTVSGFLLLNGFSVVSPSVFYKFIFIVLCFLWLLASRSKIFIKVFVLSWLFYILVWGLYGLFSGRSEVTLVSSLLSMFKLSSTFIMFYALISLPPALCAEIKKFYPITLAVMLLNIFVSLLGYGSNSYGEYGAKGFLYGGNALSSVVVVLGLYYISVANKNGVFLMLLTALFFVTISFIIGTKSAILGIIFGVLLYLAVQGGRRNCAALILFGVFLLVLFWQLWSYFKLSPMYSRLSYFYDTGGLDTLLFSGRLEFLKKIWGVFQEQGAIGYLWGMDKRAVNYLNHDISEMDVTDIIFSFGFSTLFYYLASLLMLLVYVHKHTNLDGWGYSLAVSIVLILIGSIAGHVLFNGVVTPYWALALAIPVLEYRSSSEKKRESLCLK